jgi:type II secretory pathway pseudopilin PulG
VRHCSEPGRRGIGGLVLLALLIFLALVSLATALAAEVWATTRQRDREAELLFVGDQYRRAIESYWRATPGRVKVLPRSLAVLLQDDRFPVPVRHLRRLYADPITGEDFVLLRQGGAVAGVLSPSKAAPLKIAGFPPRYRQFEAATSYEQWQFIFVPPRSGIRPPPRPAAAQGPQTCLTCANEGAS